MYNYKISPRAEKFIKKIKDKDLKDKYQAAIIEIRKNPTIGELKKGNLAGIRGWDIYHHGVNYELAYVIEEIDGLTVIIILAGTRENFYEDLKKYTDKFLKSQKHDAG